MAEKITLINLDKVTEVGQWEKLAISAINDCAKIKKEREVKILVDRFGLGKKPKTLHAIGTQYSITRERIRQIVNNAVKKIIKNCKTPELEKAIAKILTSVEASGGYITAERLAHKLKIENNIREQNAVKFIASLSEDLEVIKESEQLKFGWISKKVKVAKIKSIAKEAEAILKKEQKPLKIKSISEQVKEDSSLVEAALYGSKTLMKTDDNFWGLNSWPHVNPKSIKDKSIYILKRHEKPIHYLDLTRRISDISSKKVTQQSVHNELIKNEEFVLVGRGIYALSDWGFTPGVVEEVIFTVLKEAGEPLHKSVIIERVLEKRIVKPSTIVLNLQKPKFKRVEKAIYTIN